jgi:hypothetical protein
MHVLGGRPPSQSLHGNPSALRCEPHGCDALSPAAAANHSIWLSADSLPGSLPGSDPQWLHYGTAIFLGQTPDDSSVGLIPELTPTWNDNCRHGRRNSLQEGRFSRRYARLLLLSKNIVRSCIIKQRLKEGRQQNWQQCGGTKRAYVGRYTHGSIGLFSIMGLHRMVWDEALRPPKPQEPIRFLSHMPLRYLELKRL